MASSPLNILIVASEVAPFSKTGGLADVTGALPLELARLGHQVRVVMPRYGSIDGESFGFKEWTRLTVPTAEGPVPAIIEEGRLSNGSGPGRLHLPVLAIRHDPFFDRKGLYQEAGIDYPDNLERFAFFCRAVMELLPALHAKANWTPDLLHAHDWQTALCVVYLKTLYANHPRLKGIRTLLTIHNLAYQGVFPAIAFRQTGLNPSLFTPRYLEFYKRVSLLKGGLVFADWLSTVSPTYSREIQAPEHGCGLDGVLRERQDRLVGIVNGVDVETWNPATDPFLPSRYSVSDLAGKRACKTALQRELDLPEQDVPLIGLVSRLAQQKGLDLVAECLPDLMALDLQIVLLGTGDPLLEAWFQSLRDQFPQRIGLRLAFDEGLAHRIEAGSDIFVMPSRYEPCGLNQLYSLRYGTIPVVRRTGGLADTVTPYSPQTIRAGNATGFRFGEATAEDLLTSLLLALRVYTDREPWQSMMQAGMRTEMSWTKPGEAYAGLYRQVLETRPVAISRRGVKAVGTARPGSKRKPGGRRR
ncbi:MAG: glycogen synthase GlgA [Nitrospiraceae bacterium]